MRKYDPTTIEGLKKSCEVDPVTGCWLWLGSLQGGGYGQVWYPQARRLELVHRLAFRLAGGMIPDGMELDHLCRVRRCFNPEHLRVVTRLENLRAPGSLHNSQKTHCPQGHPYGGANLYVFPDGRRGCRKCTRESVRFYRLMRSL